jgi:hypothetical protein
VNEFPIYFSDLTKECQVRLLKFVGVESAGDMDWDMDILPLFVYPKPEALNPE